jgi:hypothetical protein
MLSDIDCDRVFPRQYPDPERRLQGRTSLFSIADPGTGSADTEQGNTELSKHLSLCLGN